MRKGHKHKLCPLCHQPVAPSAAHKLPDYAQPKNVRYYHAACCPDPECGERHQ